MPWWPQCCLTRSLPIYGRLSRSHDCIHRRWYVISVVWIRIVIARFTSITQRLTNIGWLYRTEHAGRWFLWRSACSSREILSRRMGLSGSCRERHCRIVIVTIVDNRKDHLFDLSSSLDRMNMRKALINAKWICCLSLLNRIVFHLHLLTYLRARRKDLSHRFHLLSTVLSHRVTLSMLSSTRIIDRNSRRAHRWHYCQIRDGFPTRVRWLSVVSEDNLSSSYIWLIEARRRDGQQLLFSFQGLFFSRVKAEACCSVSRHSLSRWLRTCTTNMQETAVAAKQKRYIYADSPWFTANELNWSIFLYSFSTDSNHVYCSQ